MPSGINLLDKRPMSGLDLLDQRPNVYDFTPSEAAIPYMDIVSSTETEYGIPKNLLARLIEAESGYNPLAMSPKGAAGIAQLMPDYHPDVDPFDPEASIKYAGGYLTKLYKRFGTWEDALRAYNMGPTALARGDAIPKETQDYVKKISPSAVAKPEVKDGLNLIRPEGPRAPTTEVPTEGPQAPTTMPPAEPATGATADFYRTNTPPLPFKGLIVPTVTPELAAYMGRRGYGPRPEGGWNEFGEPLDKDGNPYYKYQPVKGVVDSLVQGMLKNGTLVTKPYETAKGIFDFILSIPAFMTGLVGAAASIGRDLIDAAAYNKLNISGVLKGEKGAGDMTVLDIYNHAAEAMRESFEFFEPGKEALLGKPTEASHLPAQIAMVPLTVSSQIAHYITEKDTFKNYPNTQGVIKFAGDALGFISIGMFLHGGTRDKVMDSAYKILKDAEQLDKMQTSLNESPDTILKQANQAALDAKKAQLELQAKKLAEDINGDVVLREQMDAIAEANAKRKIRPVTYTGMKKRTPAQVRAVMDKLPEGQVPEYLFTSRKGKQYMKVGDTWYDENRVPVTNKSIVEAAEAKKAKPGEKAPEYVPPEQPTVYEALRQAGYTDEQIIAGVPDAEVADALRNFKGGPKQKGEGKVIDYDEARLGKVRDKYPPVEPDELGGEGPTIKFDPEKREYTLEELVEEQSIKEDLAKIKDIEDHFGKPIGEISDAEMETYFTGEAWDEITDVDQQTGVEPPDSTGKSSPFFQNKETTATLKALFEERAKAVAEDPNVFFQKLLNDVNRWWHGEEVPIEEVRGALRTLATRADEYRGEFLSGRDHFIWKEAVQDASEWAAKLDRSKIEPTSTPDLHAMIPLDEIPKTVVDFLKKAGKFIKSDLRKPVFPGDARITITGIEGLKDDIYDIKNVYRNKELFDETGFWLGKDGKWRYEIDDSQLKFYPGKLYDALEIDAPARLSQILDHPDLYEVFPEARDILVGIDRSMPKGNGRFHPEENVILMGFADRSTLLHELTHWINAKVESKFLGTNEYVERIKLEMKSILDRFRTIVEYAKTDKLKEQAQDVVDSLDKQLEEGTVNSGALQNYFFLVDKLTSKDIDSNIKANLQRPIHIINAHDHYKIDPGEMESRLVSKRLGMTASQRRAEPPWETLDKMLEEEMYSPSAGHKLYSGIDPKEVIRSAKRVADFTAKARGMKAFKPKEAAKMTREEFVAATIDRTGNARRELLKRLGNEGYDILKSLVLTRGSSSLATHHLKQLSKEVYDGKDKGLLKIQDDVILSERMIDIGKYKTPKQFKFPEDVKLEDFVRYRRAYRYKAVNGIRDLTHKEIMSVEAGNKAYYEWMKKALEALRDEGLISDKEFDNMVKHNYRKIKLVDIYDTTYKSKLGKKPLTVYDSGVEALARGRETDVYEPSSKIMALEVMNRTYGRVLNNRANRNLLDLARRDPNNPFVRVKEGTKASIPTGWNRIYVFEGGERKSIYLSPEFSKEWIHSSPDLSYRMGMLLRYVSGAPILRTMATGLNWGFALANLPRDVLHIWYAARTFEGGKWKPVYSSHAPIYALQMGRDLASVFLDVKNRTGKLNNYIEDGGGMEFLVHQGRLLRRGRHIGGPFDKFYNFMGWFGETSELLTRVAIRERVLRRLAKREKISMKEAEKRQDLRDEATFVARDYMDFGQGGWATKAADNAFPYLNAGIQGTRGFWRAFTQNPFKTSYKLAQFATVVSGLYIAMKKQNPKTSQALIGNVDMQNYICIPLGDQFGFEDQEGQMRYPYLKIPLDPSQKFFKTFFEAATDKWLGNEIDVDRVVDSLKEFSPVGATELPPTISGVLGYVTNKDFWLNEDIWKKTDKPFSYPFSREEYIPGQTPEFYEDLGKKIGLSPERMKYAIEELTTSGTIWSYLLGKGYESAFGDMPKDMKEKHLAEVLVRYPIVRRFFGITNPYSQHAATIDKAKQASDLDRWLQNRGLDAKVEGHLFRGNVSKKQIRKYIRGFKDLDVQERLLERYVFHRKVKDLPNRSFWLRLKGLTTKARAKVYWHRFESLSHAEKESFRKEVAVVDNAGGVITPGFWEEVGKLRRQSLDSTQ